MVSVLVAIDPLMYREVIARSVRERRPRVEVRTAEPEDLEAETGRLLPDLVVCHRAAGAVRNRAVSWVELEIRLGPESLDATVMVVGRPPSRIEWVGMAHMLAAVDETAALRPA